MKREKIYSIIDGYFDGELTKEEEIFLFTHLSRDEKARDYFKRNHALKTALQSSVEDFPENLEVKILNSVSGTKGISENYIKKYLPAGVFALLALILSLVSFFLYSQTTTYKEKLDETIWQVNQQQKMIQLLFNSLPTTEVKGRLKNQVIVTPKM